ncbi:LysM peptidoglycan-binding domain-containing protein [Planococcus sp. N028]|uniref:LysM peptidoglycan-binding domain-containing protein n=1 Tax=Planococcus shixiaomingii TaxID=3058393 RepID=A0ABT8MZX6_9BACL|nr:MULTISPECIES: LysM peptidoglycan-binding domain-containing protein [unclassified Planococcus (in: firmicutes)]MDN7241179.1 LysM peptidoglycan-binding domain-containing protein [Planococcus sp. N028]WKA53448.1 LysM peptidoglycan-binding domain-containing protein [Planococcus sp. N022]
MTFIQRNSYLILFFSLILTFSFYTVLSLKGDETQVSHVEIKDGDTLWTLAESFSGKTPHHQWIEQIMKDNNLSTPHIVAGQSIKIPTHQLKYTPDDGVKLAGDAE